MPKIPEKIQIYMTPVIRMLLIFLIGHIVAKLILRIIKRAFSRTTLDQSLVAFLTKAISITFHLLIVISALSSIGVSTSGIVAALSAVGVAVAVGLKDSLSNVAGGILLLISPRFSTGDYIETESDGGTVLTVDLLHTVVRTPDNKQISIPNGVLMNSHITNYSIEPKRRVDITFPISYESDVELAKSTIKETINAHSLVLQEPASPLVRVLGYRDSNVEIVTRCWCDTENYWELYFDLTEQVRIELEKKGINIPYNQLDVHITQEK